MEPFTDYADKSYLRQPMPNDHAAKLERAREYLGRNWCLAKDSKLVYARAGMAVPNIAGRSLSGLRAPCGPLCRVA